MERQIVLMALLAGLFTWSVTALGAGAVLLTRRFDRGIMDRMLGFGAGVMLASSYWSLLDPGIARAEALGMTAWLVAAAGLLLGGAVLALGDRVTERLLARRAQLDSGETGTRWHSASAKRCLMLVGSITLHNIPEGLAVGVAFGALAGGGEQPAALQEAWLLALGIGLQNFPEGAAVSLPLRREGMGRGRAFFLGQLSGFVEPISAVVGAVLASVIRELLPGMLCFAAGAMLWAILSELVPESQRSKARIPVTLWTMIGFAVMMILDVAAG